MKTKTNNKRTNSRSKAVDCSKVITAIAAVLAHLKEIQGGGSASADETIKTVNAQLQSVIDKATHEVRLTLCKLAGPVMYDLPEELQRLCREAGCEQIY